MTPQARDLVDMATRLGFTYTGHNGNGHLTFTHTNGQRVTLPATPSEYRGRRNSQLLLERVAGRKLPRVNKRRSHKRGETSGFSIDVARKESATWHQTHDQQIGALLADRDRYIAACREAARRRHTLPLIPPLLDNVAAVEKRLAHLGNPVEPFDPFTLGKETRHA